MSDGQLIRTQFLSIGKSSENVNLNHVFFSFLIEMAEISAFKNYKPGDPTCRLYIKNLAKHVEEKVNDGFHRTTGKCL